MAYSTTTSVVTAISMSVEDCFGSSHTITVKNPKDTLNFDASETMSGILKPYGATRLKKFVHSKSNNTEYQFA